MGHPWRGGLRGYKGSIIRTFVFTSLPHEVKMLSPKDYRRERERRKNGLFILPVN